MMAESTTGGLATAGVRLEPLAEANREALRRATAEDPDIWNIYSYSLMGEGFDRWWDGCIRADAVWRMFTIHQDDDAAGSRNSAGRLAGNLNFSGRLAGVTGFAPDLRHPGVAELGSTYLRPAARGSGLNRVMKWLLLSHLFESGVHRVEFRVDARNGRSRAAVLKLGAIEEGVLRHHKLTHTGFIRDTHVYAITVADWARLEPLLRPPRTPPSGLQFSPPGRPAGGGSSS